MLLQSLPQALHQDNEGVLRVSKTRIPVDTVIAAWHEGASAEEIALRYDSLPLADIYDLMGYYLRHRTDVDAYLSQRQLQSKTVREQVNKRQGVQSIREMLTARSTMMEDHHAVAGR